ncbi:hypothetical protein EMIT0232MI5_30321 [Pseudomonas sp. IT-232MI5]
MSVAIHRPDRPSRLWIQQNAFRPSRLGFSKTLSDRVDWDSAKHFQAESIMDSAKHFQVESIMDAAKHFQVGVVHKHPPISPLSLWERARVRGSSPDTPHHQPAPRLLDETLRKIRRRHR